MHDETLNVRCCCTPGLVLGRLPNRSGRSYNWLLRPIAVPLAAFDILELSKEEAHGPIVSFRRQGEWWSELAWNSNHADAETLARIEDFELVCNIPARRVFK